MTSRTHAWRLLRIALKYRLLALLHIEPLSSLPLPRWLRLLVRFTRKDSTPFAAGERLRDALIELGPVYIKLGQLLSTRRDVIPSPIADALASLQDSVPPFSEAAAREILRRSLAQPLHEVFERFDNKPLAAASIAQVHTARLRGGQEVVVKIRRPDIEARIDETLLFLREAAAVAEQRSSAAHRLRVTSIIDDYDRTIHAELDLALEGRNTARLRANFAHSPLLYVPRPWLNLSSRDVLVLERINGVPISDNTALEAAGVDKALLAEKGVLTFFKQVFIDNFFHADMHPGNVFVDLSEPDDPRYIALDCAIIGSLTQSDQQHLAKSLVAFFNRDYARVAQLYAEQGWTPPGTDIVAFAEAIERVCDPHFAKPLGEISFGAFLTDLFQVVESFDIRMQPQLILLQKTLLYVEGLGRSLYPQLDLWTTAKPFMETWLIERNGPAAIASRVMKDLPDVLSALLSLPTLLTETTSRLRSLEILQADQAARLAVVESALTKGRQVRRRTQWAAVALVTAGTLFLFGAFNDSAGAAPVVQTTFGAAGALAGLALLLRTLFRF